MGDGRNEEKVQCEDSTCKSEELTKVVVGHCILIDMSLIGQSDVIASREGRSR